MNGYDPGAVKAGGVASRGWAVAMGAAVGATLLFWLPVPLFPGRGISFAALPVLLAALWAGPWAGAAAALLALTAGWASGTADVASTASMVLAPLVAVAQRRGLHPALACAAIPVLVACVDALARGLAGGDGTAFSVAALQGLLNLLVAYLLVSLRPTGLQRPVTRPLGHGLFVVLAAVAVALLTLFGALAVWDRQRQQVEGALESVDVLAQDVAQSAELLLRHESLAIAAFGRSLSVSGIATDDADLADRLVAYVEGRNDLLTMLVARPDGVVVAAAAGRPGLDVSAVLGSSVADREYFQAALREAGPYVSDAFRGRGFGSDLIVAVSAPIPGSDGLAGVVEASLDLREIEDILYTHRSRRGFDIALTDRAGRIAASQGEAFPGRGELLAPPGSIVSSADWASSGGRALAADEWLAGTARLPEIGWSVLVLQPASALQPAIDAQFGRLMRNLLLTLAVMLLVSALLSNWLGRPLRRLTEALAAGGRLAEPGMLAYLRTAPREVRALGLRLMRAQHSQRQARALRSSEARWRTMAEIAPDAVVVVDEDGRIVYGNTALRQLVGREPAELDGQDLAVIVPPRLREGHERGFARYLAEGTRRLNWRSTEIPVQRSDGSEVTVEIAFGDYVHEGRRYIAGYLRDITARTRQEEETRRAREAAESANRAKDVFLATMSHEIRTPLHGLIGTLELLERGKPTGEAGRRLAVARSSAEALRQIANDVLDLSAIEEGRLRIEHRPFDLRRLVGAVTGGFESAAAGKGLQITSRVAAEVPARVVGDENRLRQILSNLFNNALKFTTAGGIDLRVVATVSPTVVFQVRDTGIGVPEDKRDHIFARFAQADEAHSRYYGGVGLGLSISRFLAEAMGGRLTLAETGAEGSVFQLELPLPAAAASDGAAPGPEDAGLARSTDPVRGARILVVDDNAANRLVVEAYLRELGAEVALAGDADTALDVMRNRAFDAVLMDIQMPGKDGYQATREIREAFGAAIPVIAMTANTGTDERARCREAGLDDLLSKPFLIGELRDLLVSQLDRAQPAADRGAPATPAVMEPLLDGESPGSVLRRFADRPATLKRLLSALQESLQGYLSRLEGAPGRPREELLATLHGLKGTAAMYGAARLEAAAAGVEDELRRGAAPDSLAEEFRALEATARETLAELERRLEAAAG